MVRGSRCRGGGGLVFLLLLALASTMAACGGGRDEETRTTARPRAQWGAPLGRFAGHDPRGVVIRIHGGGWQGLDPAAFDYELEQARTLRARGYATVTIDYRAGAAGVADADRFYEETRRAVGDRPICAMGSSAGGTIALLLAVHHPDLACAISLAGPTDLPALADQPGGTAAYDFAVQAFGTDDLARFSPALQADRIRSRLMVVAAANDPLVPLEQVAEMARADPGTRVVVLPAGDERGPFVHSRVDRAAALRAQSAELAFLAAATATGSRATG